MNKNFRDIEHNLCIVLNTPYLNIITADIVDDANGFLCYGYIDKQAGLTYEVLAYVSYIDGDYTIVKEDQTVGIKVRGESFNDATIIPIKNKALTKRFEVEATIVEETYYSKDEVENTRRFTSLDKFRHEFYPDDVQAVSLTKYSKPEGIWVRLKKYVGAHENMELFMGELLNTPFDPSYEKRIGETVLVATINNGNNEFCFIANNA